MAISPHEASRAGAVEGRPVLGAVHAAQEALLGSGAERVWALSDGEVAEAMQALGRLSGSVEAHLVAVMAEGRRRGLGSGGGWGPVDWARAQAPQLASRQVLDLDAVAGAGPPRR